MKTYYEVLDVAPSATDAEIKEQYRLLIQAWHPDKFSNPAQKEKALEKAKEINRAFDVLGKPEKRKAYDQQLGAAFAQQTPTPPPPPRPSPRPARTVAEAYQGSDPERKASPPPDPLTGISPLADFNWLLLFGDEYTYGLDEREVEASAGGSFRYRSGDWPVSDHLNARSFWLDGDYRVEVRLPPYRLIAGESSRCLTGGASLTAVSIGLDRDTPAQTSFGILLNLAYLGDDPQDARRYPHMRGKGVATSYYAFCLHADGEWEFRSFRGWEDQRGSLVERGFCADIPKSIQRGRPLEVCAALRDSYPLSQGKVRVRLGINASLVSDLFAPGRAWRRGGIFVDAPNAGPGEGSWAQFSDFHSYFLTQK